MTSPDHARQAFHSSDHERVYESMYVCTRQLQLPSSPASLSLLISASLYYQATGSDESQDFAEFTFERISVAAAAEVDVLWHRSRRPQRLASSISLVESLARKHTLPVIERLRRS